MTFYFCFIQKSKWTFFSLSSKLSFDIKYEGDNFQTNCPFDFFHSAMVSNNSLKRRPVPQWCSHATAKAKQPPSSGPNQPAYQCTRTWKATSRWRWSRWKWPSESCPKSTTSSIWTVGLRSSSSWTAGR